MTAGPTLQGCSRQRRRLVELMREIGFGVIHDIGVRQGEPELDCCTEVERHVRFGGGHGWEPKESGEDFLLKAQVVGLFELFDRLRNGTILRLEVKDGLPFQAAWTHAEVVP